MPKMIANYANSYGKSQINLKSNIKLPQKIRLINNGQLHSQRCKCSGIEIKNRKFQPVMVKGEVKHRKECKYA
jgi:hypothetical protein